MTRRTWYNELVFYQAKVLADQPIAYFDGASTGYLSLITEAQRSATTPNWTLSGCTTTTSFSLNESSPIPTSATTKITTTNGVSGGTCLITSPTLGQMKDLSASGGVVVSGYIRIESDNTETVSIKFQWNDGGWQTETADIPVPDIIAPTWVYFSHSFDLTSMAYGPFDYRVAYGITDIGGGAASNYIYYINGVSVGQESENFASQDLGMTSTYTVPSISGKGVCTINKYNGGLTAVKSGVPLHLGLDGATLLQPYIPEQPSLTISDCGFAQKNNRPDTTTLEFWLRVCNVPTDPVRIVGPVGKRTGLYLTGTTLTLSIGGTEAGYDIGQIDYPSLIDWVISPTYSSVMVNGDSVINIAVDVDVDDFTTTGAVGFYTDRSIHPVYISSIATFQYAVPSVLAKARFVAGQAVDNYGLTTDKFDGVSYSADFSNSEFAANLSYPDYLRWNRGHINNLSASDDISLPRYELPEVLKTSIEPWLLSNAELRSRPITAITSNDTTPLDAANNNTQGTAFTNAASNGEVYTTQAAASSSTNTITVPSDIQAGTQFTVYGEAKFAGTTPQLTVTFVGPNTTYTTDFTASSELPYKYTATATYDVPAGTTSITWGVMVGAGITYGQFNNVYCKFSYKQAPIVVKPTGYSTEPYLHWKSLNVLDNDRVASIVSTMSIASSSGTIKELLSIRKTNTQTALTISLSGTTVTYEYSDYSQTTVLATKTIQVGKQFNVGVDISSFLANNPVAQPLFSQPASVEVLVGGGEGNSFDGNVYHVSFYNDWHKEKLSPTFTNGLADVMIPDSLQSVEVATYSLIAVTEYGNFTLDVAAAGHWQETYPLSFFTKEVEDGAGQPKQRIDFLQVTLGKTRADLPVESYVPMSYQQLQSRYWGRSYADVSADYATYSDLGAATEPLSDASLLDVQTWVSLQKNTDSIKDYTQLSPAVVDKSGTVYVDSNDYRYFVQDGYSIIVPYVYNHNDYSLTFFHIVTARGLRSSPAKLKSFELASWASSATKWTALGTQEGNNAYPYTHNGAYYVLDFPNVFEVTKRSYNYLYKSNRSGYKPKSVMIEGYDGGIAYPWKRSSFISDERTLGGISTWLRFDSQVMTEELKIMTVTSGASELFTVHAVPVEDGTRFAIQARDSNGLPYTNIQWYVNGNLTPTPYIRTQEWNILSGALATGYDTNGETVYLRTAGLDNMSYDHATIHGTLKAIRTGSTIYRYWSDVDDQTWEYWTTITWNELFDVGVILSSDIECRKMVQMLTETQDMQLFSASISTLFDEIFVIRDIEWVDMPVITK